MIYKSRWKEWGRMEQKRKWKQINKNITEVAIPAIIMAVFCYGFSVLWLLVW